MADPKRVYKAQLDPVDAEQIQEMLDSPGWALVKRGLEQFKEVMMRDLTRDHTEIETAKLRGAIESATQALGMPAAIQAEARKGGKKDAQVS